MSCKVKVMVLAGGPSREREVSLESGRTVKAALEDAGFEVFFSDITPDNLSALDCDVDVFFPALHGSFGEDGELQRIMEERSLCFCGSPSSACKIAMDKYLCKLEAIKLNIPTARFDVVMCRDDISSAKACWTMPVVVKPIAEGSSIGVSIVRSASVLSDVVDKTFHDYGPIIIEDYIDGREFTVGILKDFALPIIEIKPAKEFYDYEAKYIDDRTEFIFVEDLSEELYRYLQNASLDICRKIGIRDFARVDWRIDKENTPFFLEINPIPGLTDHSLFPKAARKAGYSMKEVCKLIVESALERRYQRV